MAFTNCVFEKLSSADFCRNHHFCSVFSKAQQLQPKQGMLKAKKIYEKWCVVIKLFRGVLLAVWFVVVGCVFCILRFLMVLWFVFVCLVQLQMS